MREALGCTLSEVEIPAEEDWLHQYEQTLVISHFSPDIRARVCASSK
jgi:hypothetical protein